MLRGVWQALNSFSNRVTFTAIVPGAYPGEAKMCLRLSWRNQMLTPAKRVKATTYRRDSREVAKFCLRLIAETDAHSVGDSHPSCWVMLRTMVWKMHLLIRCPWPLTFQPQKHVTSRISQGQSLNTFDFELFCGQTGRQTNRRPRTFYPRRSIESAGIIIVG